MADNATRTQGYTRPATLADGWEQLPVDAADWSEGQRLGPYRLVRRLGRGGMGVVWLAEQLEPLHREVAIKLLPRERHNALSEVYFEIERQALAQLAHPAIAQIYDAGRLPDGALFFAMEYVRGMPLDDHVDGTHPDDRSIAGLLVEICRGVHHAHQRGLIHRDLKPQNILVEVVDGHARPKIIDFGIAIGTRPGESAVDEAGHAIGTPAYMSPEQRQPGPGGIDARSDVYALGAILVELLCRTPGRTLDPSEIDSGIRRRGLEISLGRTTRREALAGGGDEAKAIDTLAARLRGARRELRAIALKALAEDREQRYDSAAAMAEDLAAWLAHRPVRAMGDSRRYAMACFVRRHALATAAAGLVAVALVVGVLLALHGMNRAREAQALAEQRRDEGERLIQYMLGDFADKLRPINRLDLLDGIGQQALDYLTAQAASADPRGALARARALRTLGEVQVTRQQFDLADRSLSEADTVLAPWLDAAGDNAAELTYEAAQVAFWRGAIAYRKQQYDVTGGYWQRYRELAERFAGLAPGDERSSKEVGSSLQNLGTLAEAEGRLEDALRLSQDATSLRRKLAKSDAPAHAADLSNSLSWTARIQTKLGRPHSARQNLIDAIAAVREARKVADSNALLQREATLCMLLGITERGLGNEEAAVSWLQQSLELARLDTANDATQPRRHAQLARVAFELAVSPMIAQREARSLLDEGLLAAASVRGSSMRDSERMLTEARSCIAALAIAPDVHRTRCMNEVWPPVSHQVELDANNPDLAEARTWLGLALAQVSGQGLDANLISEMREQLVRIPAVERQSISHLLLMHAISEWLEPGGTESTDYARRVAELRARPSNEVDR